MKAIYTILITGIISLSICLGFTVAHKGSNRTAVRVTENERIFKLEASYNPAQTKKVADYINGFFKPEQVFKNEEDANIHMKLNDGADFYIKTSAGSLLLKLDKRINSEASLNRIKKLCNELTKNVIKAE